MTNFIFFDGKKKIFRQILLFLLISENLLDPVIIINKMSSSRKAGIDGYAEDPLTLAESFRNFTCKDGSTAEIQHFSVASLPSDVLDWTLDLMERNMRSMYEESSWGWKPEEKKEEMTEEQARYIIAFINEKPVAFSHFRLDMDYGCKVVYCYEVQLEPHVRSLGLGKHIMRTLESFSTHLRLSKVILTVFKHNAKGVEFFRRIGYKTDKTSPSEKEKQCYFVLSKPSQVKSNIKSTSKSKKKK